MALHVLTDDRADLLTGAYRTDNIRRMRNRQWAATSSHLGYWIGGFETEDEALLIADSLEKAQTDAVDAMNWS